MRRKPGSANVEEHPKGSGVFRVRARISGRLVTVARGMTRPQANAAAGTYAVLRDEKAVRDGITLDQYGPDFLGLRERRGLRSVSEDRNRWKSYISTDPVGAISIATLRRSDVIEWRNRLLTRKLARQTVRNALNLLRVALSEALDQELVTTNVARDVKVPRRVGITAAEEDLSGVLNPKEQAALLAAVPAEHEALVLVALMTGLRWSELSWLKREDVKGDELLIRRSRKGGPTKSGKPRRVPLLGGAKAALTAQLATLPKGQHWIFPSEDGVPRRNRPRAWKAWVTAAGIKRAVRWHDLRHTTATSLLAGWWSPKGERWTLDEVCQMLGHANISTTERYAKKLDETLTNAAAKTKFPGGNGSGGTSRNDSQAVAFLNRRSAVRISPGAQQESCSIPDPKPGRLGTIWELPDSLKRAVKRTRRKTSDGLAARRLAKIYRAARNGDEATAVAGLTRMARAAR